MRKLYSVLLFLMLFPCLISAASISSNGNGNWNSSSTWRRNGNVSLPACGDTIYIQPGTVVTVNSQESYMGCAAAVFIDVKGTLQFTNGNKLDLPCGSFVNISSGGIVKKATSGGGNSTLISICNTTMWNAGMGELTGPVYLPVLLLNFEAKQVDERVKIKWSTATESNNDYFNVQRSSVISDFRNISYVKGSGNSNTILYYSAIDSNPPSGILYYRLCQVDYDGTQQCYPPSALSMKKKNGIIVFPNPSTSEHVSVLFYANANANYVYELRDINGKLIFEQSGNASHSGFNTIELDKNYPFSKGLYFIKFTIDQITYQEKIIIS